MNTSIKYSKYDNVVAKKLPIYMDAYCHIIKDAKEYIIDYGKSKRMDEQDAYIYRLKTYQKYTEAISAILDKLKNKKINLTREKIDHIIWYGLK